MGISNINISQKMDSLMSRLDLRLILVLIIYTIFSVFLFRYYPYQINPDGITYITIARSYISGNFYGAINDYWGPLLSWLMIPFLFFAKTPVAALYSVRYYL